MASSERRPNRLIHETSAYLRQHAYNPVDWYPWGPEAFERARRENKPIFLSIGYSSCHWCHVMERESFEDPEIADLLNRHFVSIKVDREERPDVDHAYMAACQAMTGHGGWPLSVFLTPEGKPFFAGTYFPPARRYGMPAFREVLEAIAETWRTRRKEIQERADNVWQAIRQAVSVREPPEGDGELDAWGLLADVVSRLEAVYDDRYGGFGGAPKFPRTAPLHACLWYGARTGNSTAISMATHTLNAMADGGMYDQIGGGFHRYSTDVRWLVPHFEKMLYDNALLLALYAEAYVLTRSARYTEVAEGIADYLIREMRLPEGAFAAAQDADSEGEEGKYYVWTWGELREILDDDELRVAELVYGASEHGNWEGRIVLYRNLSLEQAAQTLGVSVEAVRDLAARVRAKLFAARQQRVAPERDDKVVASWNGLTIDALARAALILQRAQYLDVAVEAATFLWDTLTDESAPNGTIALAHSWCRGKSSGPAFLDDYAAVAGAFLTLYEAGAGQEWLHRAGMLCGAARRRFERARGVWAYVSSEHDVPVPDLAELHDSATPSATALWLCVLGRLGWLNPGGELQELFELSWRNVAHAVRTEPIGCLSTLLTACFAQAPPAQISFDPPVDSSLPLSTALRTVWQEVYLPWKVCRWSADMAATAGIGGLLDGSRPVAVTVCLGTRCFERPADAATLREQLVECVGTPPAGGS